MMESYRYKWVSVRLQGQPYPQGAEKAERQGWEPVPVGEEPTHLSETPKYVGKWPMPVLLDPAKGVEQDGMKLYRMAEEKAEGRDKHYRELSAYTLISAQEHYMRDVTPLAPKFVSIKADHTEPPERLNYRKYIDEFPENPTDEFRENAECIVDDFLFPAIAYKAEHAGFIDEIRAKLKQLPFTKEAWVVYMKRHDGFDVGANYQEAVDRDRAARKVLYASQYDSLDK